MAIAGRGSSYGRPPTEPRSTRAGTSLRKQYGMSGTERAYAEPGGVQCDPSRCDPSRCDPSRRLAGPKRR
eukprot:1445182-Rhodomonas_salina.1